MLRQKIFILPHAEKFWLSWIIVVNQLHSKCRNLLRYYTYYFSGIPLFFSFNEAHKQLVFWWETTSTVTLQGIVILDKLPILKFKFLQSSWMMYYILFRDIGGIVQLQVYSHFSSSSSFFIVNLMFLYKWCLNSIKSTCLI